MTKKIIVIFTALLLTASFCACSGGKGNGETTATSGTVNIETESGSNNESLTGTSSSSNSKIEIDYPDAYDYDDVDETVYVISPVNLHDLEDYDEKFSVVAGTSLKRVGISTSSDKNADGYWSKVVYGEKTYYVASAYLTLLADPDAGFVAVEKTVVLKTAALNIRKLPEMGNNIIGHFNEGDQIKVIAENTTDGWYKVEFVMVGETEKSVGYIASNAEYFESETAAE